MKELCFIVNVDYFFHSHRKPLERMLSSTFNTTVIAGYSGLDTEYTINTFEVKSRIPTIRGIYQFYREIKKLNKDTILIIVSPVMIILSHFLLRNRRKVFYNFSGLGFLRSLNPILRNMIFNLIKVYPVLGYRVFIVQNSDDYMYLIESFGAKRNFHIEIIPGSGHEASNGTTFTRKFNKLTIGFVGRIRKDKGVLDLVRAVTELVKIGYEVDLKIWGELDEKRLHGFNKVEIEELKIWKNYFYGFSKSKEEMFSSFNWFCLPSNGEGLSKAAIEACSYRLPLILSNVPGNRDMINGNGFLFEYGNVENLKNVIIDISNLPIKEIELMSEKSRRLFEANWTIESIQNKWNEILINYDTISA